VASRRCVRCVVDFFGRPSGNEESIDDAVRRANEEMNEVVSENRGLKRGREGLIHLLTFLEERRKRQSEVAAACVTTLSGIMTAAANQLETEQRLSGTVLLSNGGSDRIPNIFRDRTCVETRIRALAQNDPTLFKRCFRLSVEDFEVLHDTIAPMLQPVACKSRQPISARIKLAMTLRFLAGGIYLDIAEAYHISHNHVHEYAVETILAIDEKVQNIVFPWDDDAKLSEMAASYTEVAGHNAFHGAVAAGDGILFKITAPKESETRRIRPGLYFSRKGFYAFPMIAFCDARCRFVSTNMLMPGSANDSGHYSCTQFSANIRDGRLDPKYFVLLDGAFAYSDQELTPWNQKGLTPIRDAYNYHFSALRVKIEQAFGQLVRRWGIFWRPMSVALKLVPRIISVCCKLHNICVDRFGTEREETLVDSVNERGSSDHREDDSFSVNFDDRSFIGKGKRSDLQVGAGRVTRRDKIALLLQSRNMTRPKTAHAILSKDDQQKKHLS